MAGARADGLTALVGAGYVVVWAALGMLVFPLGAGLAATLMRIFAIGLGMDERYFDDKIDRHITNFSVLHYPPQHEPRQLRPR